MSESDNYAKLIAARFKYEDGTRDLKEACELNGMDFDEESKDIMYDVENEEA